MRFYEHKALLIKGKTALKLPDQSLKLPSFLTNDLEAKGRDQPVTCLPLLRGHENFCQYHPGTQSLLRELSSSQS